MQLLTSAKILTKNDYDYGVEGFYRPLDAIQATHPVVIMDEPHRFNREQTAFKAIMQEIKPQCLIRFGATFPENTSGRGRNKVTVKDYQNLLYDLNSCESFNQNLIKGVAKEHFEPLSNKHAKIKVVSMVRGSSVNLQLKKENERTRSFTVDKGESLSMVSDAFEGVTVLNVSSNTVEFSNGIEKTKGEELDVDVYMSSYQEQMMRLALQRHFETEKENFCNRIFKIKTLALFFIDDRDSYRVNNDGRKPYLLIAFENLLKKQIRATLRTLNTHDAEYRDYLEASLADVSSCHAGYFSLDNNDSDENIAKEVNEILHGKKQLLSFKNQDGSYNTRRFLFSKWTLKEGWDNPNIFTICKLRSSGSETSKLQEVGRGLRLPVDENGNRIANETFMLNYIVDFTEAEFANELVNQINGELPSATTLSNEQLIKVASKLNMTDSQLLATLLQRGYVDIERKIIPDKRPDFFNEYPDFATGIKQGRVVDRNTDKTKQIKIRKAVYNELRDLWEEINRRYILVYEQKLNSELEEAIVSILENNQVFTEVVMRSSRTVVSSAGDRMVAEESSGVQYEVENSIPYGEFLKRIMKVTNIPITTLHKAICKYVQEHGTVEKKYFNRNSVTAFCTFFQDWRTEKLQGRFHYVKSNMPCGETVLSYKTGEAKSEVAQGRIGTKIVPGTPSSKYLYDVYAYDSQLEKENMTSSDIEEVVVYGKIPSSSIAIPTIAGGTYSPDFMYVVKKANGIKELNVIVETKGVENLSELKGTEKMKINCAKIFFETLEAEGYNVRFSAQINNKKMLQVIRESLCDAAME